MRKKECTMNTKKINEQAIESLKKYFNENKEISKEDMQPMTKEEVTNIVDSEISRYKAKIDELNELKHKISQEAEESFEKIFGKAKVQEKHHHLNTDEMEKQLKENAEHQINEMNKIKEEKTQK